MKKKHGKWKKKRGYKIHRTERRTKERHSDLEQTDKTNEWNGKVIETWFHKTGGGHSIPFLHLIIPSNERTMVVRTANGCYV